MDLVLWTAVSGIIINIIGLFMFHDHGHKHGEHRDEHSRDDHVINPVTIETATVPQRAQILGDLPIE